MRSLTHWILPLILLILVYVFVLERLTALDFLVGAFISLGLILLFRSFVFEDFSFG